MIHAWNEPISLTELLFLTGLPLTECVRPRPDISWYKKHERGNSW